MLIGGYAVSYYGYPRATGDMDIWIPVERETANKMVRVFNKFGIEKGVSPDLFLRERLILRMGLPPTRLEVTTAGSRKFIPGSGRGENDPRGRPPNVRNSIWQHEVSARRSMTGGGRTDSSAIGRAARNSARALAYVTGTPQGWDDHP